MADLIKVGLTGGIATGKSTVAQRWHQNRARVVAFIESDELAHRCLEPGTAVWEKVVGYFGRQILRPDRSIDRRQLGEIVFADEPKRLALNQMVHPAVRQLWTQALADLRNDGRTAAAVVAIPLLFETGAEKEFDVVVAVGCSEGTQQQRLMAKGMSEAQAGQRLRAQWPTQRKIDRADYVIWNDGRPELAHQQADIVWAAIEENHYAKTQKQQTPT